MVACLNILNFFQLNVNKLCMCNSNTFLIFTSIQSNLLVRCSIYIVLLSDVGQSIYCILIADRDLRFKTMCNFVMFYKHRVSHSESLSSNSRIGQFSMS